jgi:hypothetical protein
MCNVKYADVLLLLAKKETVLQGMIYTLTEIGRSYEMKMNVEETKVMRIPRQPSPVQVRIDQKQLENVEYFNYLGSMITNDARCACGIKSRIAMTKSAFKKKKKKSLFTCKLDLNLRNKLVKCYIWCTASCGYKTWTLRQVNQKDLESFEMWCWIQMEKISWTSHVRNEVLQTVNEEWNILQTIKRRNTN